MSDARGYSFDRSWRLIPDPAALDVQHTEPYPVLPEPLDVFLSFLGLLPAPDDGGGG